MFINYLNIRSRHQKPQNTAVIVPKPFIDFYNDTVGWYELGHHQPEEFLAAVTQQDIHALFSAKQVQLKWAKFEGKSFVVTDEHSCDSQPITIVEDWLMDDQ